MGMPGDMADVICPMKLMGQVDHTEHLEFVDADLAEMHHETNRRLDGRSFISSSQSRVEQGTGKRSCVYEARSCLDVRRVFFRLLCFAI